MSGTFIDWDGSAAGSGGGGGTPGAPATVGTIDSAAPSANGAVIGSTTLYMQSATATAPGLVNTGAQVWAGTKTFNSSPIIFPLGASVPVRTASNSSLTTGSTDLSSEVTGTLPASRVSGSVSSVPYVVGPLNGANASPNAIVIGSSTVYMQSASATNPGIVSSFTQTFAGVKTFSSGINVGSTQINAVQDPTTAQQAATKNYVDNALAAFQPIEAVALATNGDNLPAVYVNGVAGVGATLTLVATGVLTIDSTSVSIGQRVLAKNQTTAFESGVYDVTVAGSIGVAAVLTRSLDYNTAADMNAGDLIPVVGGIANKVTSWLQTATITTVGTDALTFVRYSYNPQTVATVVGAIDTAAASTNGGTIGSSSLYFQSASATVPGLVNNTTQTFTGQKTFANATTIGSVTVTSSQGGTLQNFVFPGVVGTTGQLLATSGSGGQLYYVTGLTNPLTTSGDIIVGSGSGVITRLAAGSTGQSIITTGSSGNQVLNWTFESTIKNVGLSVVSSASINLFITLTAADGSALSITNPAIIPTKSSTAQGGQYVQNMVTSAKTIEIPQGATLGLVSSFSQYIWVYAYGPGAGGASGLIMGVSGKTYLDDGSFQSGTAVTSGATSSGVLYTNNATSGSLPVRYLGRISLKQAVVGTYANAPDEVSPGAMPVYSTSEWAAYTLTVGAITTPPTLPVAIQNKATWRRDGGDMLLRWQFLPAGSGVTNNGSGTYTFPVPAGYFIDTQNMVVSTISATPIVGIGRMGGAANAADNPLHAGVASSTSIVFFMADAITSAVFGSGNSAVNSTFRASFDVRVPIFGWSSYGPTII